MLILLCMCMYELSNLGMFVLISSLNKVVVFLFYN